MSKPDGDDNPNTIDDSQQENNTALDLMLSTYQEGLRISYSSASALSVSAGAIMLSNSAGSIRLMVANTSATTVDWDDIDTGSEAASTTYYVYAIASATTATTCTFKISTSSSAPSGITYYTRLGSFYNDASSNMTQISNDNEYYKGYVQGQGNYYKIDTGSISLPQDTDTAISFSFTYASAPYVYCQIYTTAGLNYIPRVEAVTTTGATLSQGNNQTTTAYWIAIGQVLAQ